MTPLAEFDLQPYLDRSSGLPQPDWEAIHAWAVANVSETDLFAFGTDLARQWLTEFRRSYNDQDAYEVFESENFLLLGHPPVSPLPRLARIAESSMERLMGLLPGIAEFPAPGKQIILLLDNDSYYTYLAPHSPEGHFGTSAGMHLRCRYPHIVVKANQSETGSTVAHELVHAALMDLDLPQWIEEGLAQIGEEDVRGSPREIDVKRVRRQKEHWRTHGLESFWSGAGFTLPDDAQEHSYQLAEFLVRLLIADSRPRWFGFDRRAEGRFLEFLKHAKAVDAGQAAAEEHLKMTLGALAAMSLGPGQWEPAGGYRDAIDGQPAAYQG